MSTRVKRRVIVLAVICLVIGIAILLFNKWEGGSATGRVHTGTPTTTTTPVAPPLAVTNHYFSTVLPAGFSLKRQIENSSSSDSLVSLVATTGSDLSEQFAATVGTIPPSGIQGVGDYNLRATQTSTYQPYTPVDLPPGAVAFRTSSGAPAFTVFWPHTNVYIELSFSSDGGASLEQLVLVYEQVLHSWKWN